VLKLWLDKHSFSKIEHLCIDDYYLSLITKPAMGSPMVRANKQINAEHPEIAVRQLYFEIDCNRYDDIMERWYYRLPAVPQCGPFPSQPSSSLSNVPFEYCRFCSIHLQVRDSMWLEERGVTFSLVAEAVGTIDDLLKIFSSCERFPSR